jgi:hypothetical protein
MELIMAHRVVFVIQDSLTGLYYGDEPISLHLLKEFNHVHLFENMDQVKDALARRRAAIKHSTEPGNTLFGAKAEWAVARSTLPDGGMVVKPYTIPEIQSV